MLVKPSQDHDLRWTTKISHGVKLPYKLSVKATQNSTWDKAYFITHEKVLCTPHRKGAPSLRQSATVRCLELGLPEIEELPWTVTAQLWDFAIKTSVLSCNCRIKSNANPGIVATISPFKLGKFYQNYFVTTRNRTARVKLSASLSTATNSRSASLLFLLKIIPALSAHPGSIFSLPSPSQ